jgi:beta-lactamase class A
LPTRRDMLSLIAGTTTALALPSSASATDGSFDVSYLWSPDRDAVLDYRDQVAALLGPEVAKDLVIVHGKSGNWGLIYDRTGTDLEVARRVAAAHDRLLRAELGGDEALAIAIKDDGYTRLHNISYGDFGSLDEAKKQFDLVGRVLGPGVLRELAIETPSPGRFSVVYKRHGDHASTAAVAARHAALVKPHRLSTRVVPERYLTPVWGANSVTTPPATTGNTTAAVLTSHDPAPPIAVPPADAIDLPASVSSPVRDRVNEHVQMLRKKGLIAADETTSWYVHVLSEQERTWVAINAERSLQCASMMKPYVALAFLHRVEAGELVYGSESKARLEAMIQRSSNPSTNWAIEKVGGPAAVQKLLSTHYPSLVQETRIVEAIPTNGRTYKNRSSARDYVRLCRAMWRDDLTCSKELRRLMGLPSRDRLVTGAPSIPAGTEVFNKTGSTSHLCGDFGVIVAKGPSGEKLPYVFVGIIEKRSRASNYGAWISARSSVIRSVSDLTYRALKDEYKLA